jgi:hypothetical protein
MPWTLTSTPTKALPSREGLLNIGVKDNDVIIWPKLMDANWIQTVPGKGYSAMLRLYSPLSRSSPRNGGGQAKSNWCPDKWTPGPWGADPMVPEYSD